MGNRGHDRLSNWRLRRPDLMSMALTCALGLTVLPAAPLLAADTSMSGGLDMVAFRLFWALAPDATIVAVATPLLFIAVGIAKLLERRSLRDDSTPRSPATSEDCRTRLSHIAKHLAHVGQVGK